MTPTESAVLVVVAAAEPVVGEFRAAYDRSTAWGVPPHVTVLYPFVPPERLDDGVLERLAAAAGTVPSFDLTFARTDWFGEEVLWLAPEPAGPLKALTAAVCAAFPDFPPYGGAHDEVIPHLTIAHGAPLAVLHAVAESVEAQLPIRLGVSEAVLYVGSAAPGSWRPLVALPLGHAASAH